MVSLIIAFVVGIIIAKPANNGSTFSWNLWVRADLDREFIAEYEFQVICAMKNKNDVRMQEFRIPGKLSVLDQNDNGPLTSMNQTASMVFIKLDKSLNKVYKISQIVFTAEVIPPSAFPVAEIPYFEFSFEHCIHFCIESAA